MNRSLTCAIALLAVFLGGCVPGYYTRSDFTRQQFLQDKFECEQTATRMYPSVPYVDHSPAHTDCTDYGTEIECTTTPASSSHYGDRNAVDRESAMNRCIESNGYYWMPPKWSWESAEGSSAVTREYYEAVTPEAEPDTSVADFNRGLELYKGGNFKEAAKWFRLAAEQGMAMAQAQLGTFYNEGTGVPQDYKEAYAWFLAANVNGHEDAQALRDNAASKLNPTQLEDAQELGLEYIKKYQ